MQIHVIQTKDKGRGVAASKDFVSGEIIESAPVILITDEQLEYLEKTPLNNYYFNWFEKGSAIGLGFTSLYNHSDNSNAKYVKHIAEAIIEIVAIRAIKKGEEITTSYACDLWFDVKK